LSVPDDSTGQITNTLPTIDAIDLRNIPEARARQLRHLKATLSDSRIPVFVQLDDPWLQLAVTALLEQTGCEIRDYDNGNCYVISDDVRVKGDHVVRIIETRAGDAQAAIEAVLESNLGAAITKEDPTLLPIAINALANNLVVVQRTVHEKARSMPFVDRRQAVVLEGIALGLTNMMIAKRLGITEGSVKRIVSSLFVAFDVQNRNELMARTHESGYQVRGR
jgi:DNA-binding CsgD family transcriptional regulator